MAFPVPELAPALPEIFLLLAACVVLLIDLFWPGRQRSNTYVASQLSVLGTLVVLVNAYHGPTSALSGHYTVH